MIETPRCVFCGRVVSDGLGNSLSIDGACRLCAGTAVRFMSGRITEKEAAAEIRCNRTAKVIR